MTRMRKYFIVAASFVIMLCLGSVYAWSIIASELIETYHYSAAQTQIIFGTLIAVFSISMVFVPRLAKSLRSRTLVYLSALFFCAGYLLAGLSGGRFFAVLLGIGVFAGMATGLGYWVSLTLPVLCFPERKGLMTGVAAAGFGIGAILLSSLSEIMLSSGKDVSQLFVVIGSVYGILIFSFAQGIPRSGITGSDDPADKPALRSSGIFYRLLGGIFLGTFAGLLIIGSLTMVGEQNGIREHTLIMGVSFFALANFAGRLFWGFISDHLDAALSIFLALALQAAAIFLLGTLTLNIFLYLLLTLLAGFGFGANFVLFAKKTAVVFGVEQLGNIYPFVFLGYAIAGIFGPLSGGLLFDRFGNFANAAALAALLSLTGGLLFLELYIRTRNRIRPAK